MKIAFDVDVLAKQMSINDMVHKVADWGYKYIEQSPHPRINPFYKHPLFSKECEEEYRKAGCKTVLLACTELSVIKADEGLDDWFMDPMETLARKVIECAGKEYK